MKKKKRETNIEMRLDQSLVHFFSGHIKHHLANVCFNLFVYLPFTVKLVSIVTTWIKIELCVFIFVFFSSNTNFLIFKKENVCLVWFVLWNKNYVNLKEEGVEWFVRTELKWMIRGMHFNCCGGFIIVLLRISRYLLETFNQGTV